MLRVIVFCGIMASICWLLFFSSLKIHEAEVESQLNLIMDKVYVEVRTELNSLSDYPETSSIETVDDLSDLVYDFVADKYAGVAEGYVTPMGDDFLVTVVHCVSGLCGERISGGELVRLYRMDDNKFVISKIIERHGRTLPDGFTSAYEFGVKADI